MTAKLKTKVTIERSGTAKIGLITVTVKPTLEKRILKKS